jgi:hypothetical protein
MSEHNNEPLDQRLRRWAEGYRHAAANRHYHLDAATARETATMFDHAAQALAAAEERAKVLREERDRLIRAQICRHNSEDWRVDDVRYATEAAAIDAVRAAAGLRPVGGEGQN